MDEISDEQLISMAKEAAKKAYVPYSHFHVGSAVLSEDNYVYTGCKCVSDQKTRIKKIAIASDSNEFTWPCGICRQVMSEFMNSDGIIILENHGLIKKFKLDELLPHSFGACDIKTE